MGHGTGSIAAVYRQSAIGQTGVNATVSTNPHNQTFAVAIQLGVLGVIVLYAMWISHARLMFSLPGMEGWVGSLLVIQNIISSLFNSHLFDFTQGWTYVFGVGIIGGVALQRTYQNGQAHYRHGPDAAARCEKFTSQPAALKLGNRPFRMPVIPIG